MTRRGCSGGCVSNLPSVRRGHDGPRRGAQLATSSEPTPPKCRRARVADGQVELAAADVGAAVDDAHADHAVAPAQGHVRAARQRLVRDAERAGRQAPAARQLVAVQAGAVPRHRGVAVDVEPADLAPRGVDEDAQPGAAATAAGGRRSRRRRRRAWWRGRSSTSPGRSGAAAARAARRRRRRTRPCTDAWRPASTFEPALAGGDVGRDGGVAGRGGHLERAVPGSAASEMAKQSAPSAVTA